MMAKTLTIRLTDEQSEELQVLLDEPNGLNTASKVMIHCMMTYREEREGYDQLLDKLQLSEEKVDVLKGAIENVSLACAKVVDLSSQSDLLENL